MESSEEERDGDVGEDKGTWREDEERGRKSMEAGEGNRRLGRSWALEWKAPGSVPVPLTQLGRALLLRAEFQGDFGYFRLSLPQLSPLSLPVTG